MINEVLVSDKLRVFRICGIDIRWDSIIRGRGVTSVARF